MPGVNPGRVAALGLSMGAEEALRAAAEGAPLAAVVADGAGASTLGDQRQVIHGPTAPVEVSVAWLGMRAVELLGGGPEPAPLTEVAGRIRVPVLLIASSADGERTLDEVFRGRIGERAALWYVPDAGHTGALEERPDAYAARVAAFPRRGDAGRPGIRLRVLHPIGVMRPARGWARMGSSASRRRGRPATGGGAHWAERWSGGRTACWTGSPASP